MQSWIRVRYRCRCDHGAGTVKRGGAAEGEGSGGLDGGQEEAVGAESRNPRQATVVSLVCFPQIQTSHSEWSYFIARGLTRFMNRLRMRRDQRQKISCQCTDVPYKCLVDGLLPLSWTPDFATAVLASYSAGGIAKGRVPTIEGAVVGD